MMASVIMFFLQPVGSLERGVQTPRVIWGTKGLGVTSMHPTGVFPRSNHMLRLVWDMACLLWLLRGPSEPETWHHPTSSGCPGMEITKNASECC